MPSGMITRNCYVFWDGQQFRFFNGHYSEQALSILKNENWVEFEGTTDTYVEGDLIEMTGEGIADVATKEYLVPDTASMKLKADDAAGTGFALHKVDTGILHIGGAALMKSHPTTYVYEVVNN